MFTRRKTAAALIGAISFIGIAPAGADSDSVDDPAGDVVDGEGAAATDPTVDITGVSFTNEADEVEIEIEVATILPFSDPDWEDLSLTVTGILMDAANDDPEAPQSSMGFFVVDGEPFGYLGGCVADASQTATAYVIHAEGRCVTGLPRSIEYGAIMLRTDGDDLLFDAAPDEEPGGPVLSSASAETARVAGTDRILTAVELSQNSYPTDASAGAVVLAASLSFPDALAGGPLATYAGAPMLLTGVDGLDARTRAELERVLEPGGTVYVLGGTAAISEAVVAQVRSAGFDPQRVAGTNRFETAVAIADEIDELIGGHDTVLLADGRTFTDALIAGAAAPRQLGVVLLTDGSTMPAATDDHLGGDEAERIAIGTPAGAAASGVRRIVGANPSELSVKVAEELAPMFGAVAIASQASFADALAGGPHIAAIGAPLLLTDPQTLSAATADALSDASGSLRSVTLYGGTAALSTGVEQAIEAALSS